MISDKKNIYFYNSVLRIKFKLWDASQKRGCQFLIGSLFSGKFIQYIT